MKQAVVGLALMIAATIGVPSCLAADRGGPDRMQSKPDLPARPAGLPTDRRLEELVRDVYAQYATVAAASGHEIEFELSNFKTILRNEFGRVQWVDLMSPATGLWIEQQREYYDAPWLGEDKMVHYRLGWKQRPPETEAVEFQSLKDLKARSIAEVLGLLRERYDWRISPAAITRYTVDVKLDGQGRTYRAAAFWSRAGQEEDRFEMSLQDHVVPRVASAIGEEAEPVPEEATEGWRDGARWRDDGSATAPSTTESCKAQQTSISHTTLKLPDTQGHLEGGSAFERLRLWIDANHDGVSDAGELHPLSEIGVDSIELSYVESRRKDRHGNLLRFKSRVRLLRSTTEAVDVYFLME